MNVMTWGDVSDVRDHLRQVIAKGQSKHKCAIM